MTNLEQFKSQHKDHFTKQDIWVVTNIQLGGLPQLMLGHTVKDLFASDPPIHKAEWLGKDNLQSTLNKVAEFKASLSIVINEVLPTKEIINDVEPLEEKPKKESKTNEK